MPTPVLSPMDWLRRDRPRNRLVARHGVRARPRTSPRFPQVLSDQTRTSYFTPVITKEQKHSFSIYKSYSDQLRRSLLQRLLHFDLHSFTADIPFNSDVPINPINPINPLRLFVPALRVVPRQLIHPVRDVVDALVRSLEQSYDCSADAPQRAELRAEPPDFLLHPSNLLPQPSYLPQQRRSGVCTQPQLQLRPLLFLPLPFHRYLSLLRRPRLRPIFLSPDLTSLLDGVAGPTRGGPRRIPPQALVPGLHAPHAHLPIPHTPLDPILRHHRPHRSEERRV